VAVHVAPRATSDCNVVRTLPCTNFHTWGDLNAGYDVYVVGAGISSSDGIAGIEFGLQYDADLTVFTTTVCGDLEFPAPSWPASGSGNVVTYSPAVNCQRDNYGSGAQAVFTSMYVYAYGTALFRITERPASGQLALSDCSSAEYPVGSTQTGYAQFAAGGITPGGNPCGGSLPDIAPPILLSASGSDGVNQVQVVFNEPVPNAANAAHYEVYETVGGSPIPVNAAGFLSPSSINLVLASPVVGGTGYTVQVNGVADASGNVILPNSTVEFTPAVDSTPPTLVGAEGQEGDQAVSLRFSETLDFTEASNPANYALFSLEPSPPTYGITAVNWQGDRVNLLFDTPLVGGTHQVTVQNVEDVAGNPIAPGTSFFFSTSPPTPGALSDPKLATHLVPHLQKGDACAISLPACYEYETRGDPLTTYDVYAILVDRQGFAGGFGGVEFGLDYDASSLFLLWTQCGNLEFPSPSWPDPGAGNVVVWDTGSNCQTTPGPDGVRAIVGFFYVYAYTDALFRYTERPVSSKLSVADCTSAEYVMGSSDAGAAGFGSWEGFNPCVGAPTLVNHVTWGRIKQLYRSEEEDR
jgi:hypothetical protein